MKILPNPRKTVKLEGDFCLDANTTVFCDSQFSLQVQRFLDMVKASCNVTLQQVEDISQAQINFTFEENCPAEGYFVMISQGLATIKCSTPKGCFYAVETLRQLFNLNQSQTVACCQNCYIEDEPKFAYRGLHLDVCRHFFPVEVVEQIIELMSQVKLNKLHLHLTDDQGFRVQIDKYPLLTEVGAKRDGTAVTRDGKKQVIDQPHQGYFSKEDIRRIVRFAADHHIDVVPEIDVPGHMVAALAAYPQFSCTGAVSEVRKTWGISKDLLCAGNDGTYTFVTEILEEICDLFPYELVHLGGDEAPKDRWCNCKLCREKLAELQLDNFDQLQTYMVDVFRKHLEQKGKKVVCWNDGVSADTHPDVISQVWKPLTRKQGAKDANRGRKIIMSPLFNLYFDYPYAMTPLKRTYKFNALRGVRKNAHQNVLGVEGAVWTEHIADTEKLYFNLLPRLDALATCAWGNGTKHFKKCAQNRMEFYRQMGLPHNSLALKSKRKASVIKKFFCNESYVEVISHNAYLAKKASKTPTEQ